ncbi:porin [Candidatus Pelagibacter sp.]|jgi:outer membrane protein OmpU|nr:porin [Candidatus Pelagibacter sp.]
MNNLKKLGLTAIAASLATVSAHAADFSVSGGASISYTSNNIVGIGGGANGNPWAMSDTVNFAASGELDNGWTINYTMGLDGSKTAAGAAFEDRTLAIGLGDMGTITMMGQDGSSVVGSMDDKLPTAYEESWNFSGGPGTGTSVGNNAFKYSYGGVDGLNIEASYVPSTATAEEGSTDIGITYTGMEGLTVGLATGTDNTAGSAAEVDEQAMYVTYAYDAFTFGYQSNESDSNAAGADSDFSGWAVSYAVSDDISVSLAQTEIGREGTSTLLDSTTEHTAISASYTMGSMALKATRADVADAQGNQDRDGEAYAVELSFAF